MSHRTRRLFPLLVFASLVLVSTSASAQALAAPDLKADGSLLSWTAPPEAGVRFLIERSGPGLTFFAQIAGPIADTRYAIETGRNEAGARYTYRVRAIDAASNPGPYSNSVAVQAPSMGLPMVGNDPVALLTTLPGYRGNAAPASPPPGPVDSAFVMLSVLAPLSAEEQAKEAGEINDKDYPACLRAYEERIKQNPGDANLRYRIGICIFHEARRANEAAVAANRNLIRFIEACNRDLSCESGQNKPRIEDLRTTQDGLIREFDNLRDKAIDAFATAVAIGGDGNEIAAARMELEKLYRSKGAPGNNPLDGLDRLIAEKKKELQR
jgi:hypothetical protein